MPNQSARNAKTDATILPNRSHVRSRIGSGETPASTGCGSDRRMARQALSNEVRRPQAERTVRRAHGQAVQPEWAGSPRQRCGGRLSQRHGQYPIAAKPPTGTPSYAAWPAGEVPWTTLAGAGSAHRTESRSGTAGPLVGDAREVLAPHSQGEDVLSGCSPVGSRSGLGRGVVGRTAGGLVAIRTEPSAPGGPTKEQSQRRQRPRRRGAVLAAFNSAMSAKNPSMAGEVMNRNRTGTRPALYGRCTAPRGIIAYSSRPQGQRDGL
jgi:hypothetical protein